MLIAATPDPIALRTAIAAERLVGPTVWLSVFAALTLIAGAAAAYAALRAYWLETSPGLTISLSSLSRPDIRQRWNTSLIETRRQRHRIIYALLLFFALFVSWKKAVKDLGRH